MTRAPLVLLPGLLCDAALWAPQVAALSDIAEPRVADLARDDDIGAMAARVLAEAPPRFALAGLSMGGYVSFEVMRRAPERVTHLALLDTSARPDTPERAQVRRDFIVLARGGGFRGVTPRLLPQWVHASRMSDPDFVEAVTSMTLRVGRDAFIRQQTAILGRPDSRPGLSRIRVPTLVLCGRQDQATPVEVAREIAADIEGARLVVVEECGHLATLEQPAEVSAAMRAWLST
ncbi:MAG: alpha/beta fold hydrolase [Alphaproteobacteria bacterium]|nr:alpha/beta fold hydrolase [Alphaproteobacteria bacterium]